MSRREMNPVERWRKNQREREKKKKKLKQKEMKERDPNYGKKPDPSEKYKRLVPQTNEVPLQMQIKRDNYWKTQEENKKKRQEILDKEMKLQGRDRDSLPLDIHPPIEAPPPEKYDEVYYECLKDKNEELYPEQTFIIHTIKKQLALKRKNLRRKIKVEEEKALREHEQVEVQKHIKKQYEEEKMRKQLIEEEKKRRQNIGKEVIRKDSLLRFASRDHHQHSQVHSGVH